MKINVVFSENSKEMHPVFLEIQKVVVDTQIEHYAGDYNITPMQKQQIVQTANKLMDENLVVNAIPYTEVTNLSNGKTVTIG